MDHLEDHSLFGLGLLGNNMFIGVLKQKNKSPTRHQSKAPKLFQLDISRKFLHGVKMASDCLAQRVPWVREQRLGGMDFLSFP